MARQRGRGLALPLAIGLFWLVGVAASGERANKYPGGAPTVGLPADGPGPGLDPAPGAEPDGPSLRIQPPPPVSTDQAPPGVITVVDDGQPTPSEQQMLELINRARRNPVGEAGLFRIDLNEGLNPGTIAAEAKAPLAMNANLLRVARAHCEDMIKRDFFAHDNPDGKTPFDRIRAGLYDYRRAGENLGYQGTTGPISIHEMVDTMHQMLFVDEDVDGRGHRTNLLDAGFREAGTGFAEGVFTHRGRNWNAVMHATCFGTRRSPDRFVMGVVYADRNSDGRYTAGEGLAGIEVTLGGVRTTTGLAGAYTFAVNEPGRYLLAVRAVRPAIHVDREVTVGLVSVKVDYETQIGWQPR